jgi:hypothetical protein
MTKYLSLPLRRDRLLPVNRVNYIDIVEAHCIGVQGELSLARFLLYRAAVAGPLLVFVVIIFNSLNIGYFIF